MAGRPEPVPRRVVSLAVAYNDPQRVCVDTESMAMFKGTDGGYHPSPWWGRT